MFHYIMPAIVGLRTQVELYNTRKIWETFISTLSKNALNAFSHIL